MSARSLVVLVFAIVLLSVAFTPAIASTSAATSGAEGPAAPIEQSNATLVSAYPNPVAHGDPGEYVTVRFTQPTNTTGWTLTDGITAASLPNRTFDGTVAFSTKPAHARNHTEHPVSSLSGRLQLADDGDTLALIAGNQTVSTAEYRNAPQSERRDFEANAWVPIGATDHDPIRTDGGAATTFVLPDSPQVIEEELDAAEDRILIGGYTLTSERVTETLIAAKSDGVTVRVVLDGAPVGGVTQRQADQLDRLTSHNIEVRLLSGPHSRYQHHHPKYAVVDDRALVTTENFKPAGTGGMSSRGWGVVLESSVAADELAAIHENDRTWRAATEWQQYRAGREFTESNPALGTFDPRHAPEDVDTDAATVLIAPDNAESELVSMIDAADERILVQQVRIDSRDNELLQAALRAAERGVRVRISLDGSWYVEDDNAALIEWLTHRADASGWDLEAKIDEPNEYDKLHTKGLIVDDTAVVGSLNWVRSAKSDNREVLIALEGSEPAAYYATVFTDDWDESEQHSVPVGIFGAAAVTVSGALLVLRKIEFVGRRETVTDWQW